MHTLHYSLGKQKKPYKTVSGLQTKPRKLQEVASKSATEIDIKIIYL